MAARQLLESSDNIWVNTHYKYNQLRIEIRKTPTAEPLCCITPGMGSVGLTFPYGSARLFWGEYLTTPVQFTRLDDLENIMLKVKNTDEEKQLSITRNGKVCATVTIKHTGEIFLSFSGCNTMILPKTSLQFVVDSSCPTPTNSLDTSVSKDNMTGMTLQHNPMNIKIENTCVPAQTETDLVTPTFQDFELQNMEPEFCLSSLGFGTDEFDSLYDEYFH
jgi:hypothetical protein